VLVEPDDLPDAGERVWLKGFGCVRYDGDAFAVADESINVVREGDVDVVHWVPADEGVPTRLRTMDGDVRGHAEPGVREYGTGDLLQFERIGFARLDAFDGGDGTEELVAYYAHR
jgi:glutamyl-tRNA synthetase